MAHTCRGTIPLATAHIEVGETCHLVLTSEGRSYHLKATSEGECQRWVSALQQAKGNATLLMHHSGEMDLSEPLWTVADSAVCRSASVQNVKAFLNWFLMCGECSQGTAQAT